MATKSTYTVRGSVRGTIYTGRSLSAALTAMSRDHVACDKRGSYSDCNLYCDGKYLATERDDERSKAQYRIAFDDVG
jgi:hypothetical protein